jgi:predicted anti-sigma-YlaC factor YlaD
MMHDIVVEELERHLSGSAPRAFYEHLDQCAACRAEVAQMDELSSMFEELRTDAAQTPVPQPTLGFYARVRNQIFDTQKKEAWSLFSPGAAFFRRISFESLLLLDGLGSLLLSLE